MYYFKVGLELTVYRFCREELKDSYLVNLIDGEEIVFYYLYTIEQPPTKINIYQMIVIRYEIQHKIINLFLWSKY